MTEDKLQTLEAKAVRAIEQSSYVALTPRELLALCALAGKALAPEATSSED